MKTLPPYPLLLSLVLATLVSACQEKGEPATAVPPPIIDRQQLRYPAQHPQLTLLSTVAAVVADGVMADLPARVVWNEEKTQRIYPAFAGRVIRITTDVGQRVEAGQTLALLASPDFGAAQADTWRAQTDARLAEQALRRQRELLDAGVLARKDFEQAEAEASRAWAEVTRAQARTSLYGGTGGVHQQLALRSEVAGVVVERNIGPGQELRPDGSLAPLFTITDPRNLWVLIDAQEADLKDLMPGARIELMVPSLGRMKFTAVVEAVPDLIDPASRSIKVRASVDNPKRLLKHEMLARARYQRQIEQVLEVPASAVFLSGNQHHVFVQSSPGVFEVRDVQVVHEGPQRVLLSSGLTHGEQVVSENGLLLARELRLAQQAVRAEGRSK